MIFSCLAYFLVENRESGSADSSLIRASKELTTRIIHFFTGKTPIDIRNRVTRTRDHGADSADDPQGESDQFPEYRDAPRFRGRRFLLLMSFAAGVVTLFLTSMMFNISDKSKRLPLIRFFIIVFTAVYSPVSMTLSMYPFKGTACANQHTLSRVLVRYYSCTV